MPTVELVFYREEDGSVLVLEWLYGLETRVVVKCRARLTRLQEQGHLLRRPEADYVGAGIYELRILCAGQRYRILYGFRGRSLVLLLAAFSKTEGRIPAREIRLARDRFERYYDNPECRGYSERGI